MSVQGRLRALERTLNVAPRDLATLEGFARLSAAELRALTGDDLARLESLIGELPDDDEGQDREVFDRLFRHWDDERLQAFIDRADALEGASAEGGPDEGQSDE